MRHVLDRPGYPVFWAALKVSDSLQPCQRNGRWAPSAGRHLDGSVEAQRIHLDALRPTAPSARFFSRAAGNRSLSGQPRIRGILSGPEHDACSGPRRIPRAGGGPECVTFWTTPRMHHILDHPEYEVFWVVQNMVHIPDIPGYPGGSRTCVMFSTAQDTLYSGLS